jgi:hypothetical protein
MVDEIFNAHEANLRAQVRQLYRFDVPDTSKLRVAIEEIEKVLMKLAHPSSSLPALKKAMLLDQRALLDFFNHLRNPRPALPQEHFFSESNASLEAVRNALERSINLEIAPEPAMAASRSYVDRRFSNNLSVGEWEDPFEPLRVTVNDYFWSDCRFKALHFFVPCSFELKMVRLEEAGRHGWQTLEFKAKKELPCYFKSIATPSG